MTQHLEQLTIAGESIPAIFESAVAAAPEAVFLKRRTGEALEELSYRKTSLAVNGLAELLAAKGLSKGERIALLAENSWEWVVAYLGILQAGCVVVPLDTLMPLPDILNILQHSQARILYCSKRFLDEINALPNSQRLNIATDSLPKVETLLNQRREDVPFKPVFPRDLAVIIYTSGTTGNPKGVMLSQGNLASNVHAARQVIHIRPNDTFLMLLPLHHAFSATVNMLLAIGSGASTALATSYRSREIIADLRVAKVTILIGVPQVFENIMNGMLRAVAGSSALKRALFHSLMKLSAISGARSGRMLFKSFLERAGVSSVRLMVSGGAALSVRVNQFFNRIGLELLQGYGLTECSPVLSVNPPEKNILGSVGPPLKGITFRIDQPNEAGIGEVWAQGPNIMQGYFKNEAATQEVLHDGWLRTGDAGYLDSDGYLYLTGRLKNIIVTSAGKNVYPEEIEAKLSAEAEIAEVLVVGVKRKERSGEDLYALLKMDEEHLQAMTFNATAEQIAAEVVRRYNNSTKPHLRIREWKILEDEFEKTSTRKIKRFHYQNYFD